MSLALSVLLSLAAATMASACSDDTVAADLGVAGEGGARVDARDAGDDGGPAPFETGDDGHADVQATLAAGAVRAGKVTSAAALLSGIKVEGKVGDFKIYNSRVAFIIQGVRDGNGVGPYGGEVLDAMRLGQPGSAGHSVFGELLFAVGTTTIKPTSVTVLEDGSKGTARVRAVGTLAPIPQIESLVPGLTRDRPIDLAIDYVLEPDSDVLRVEFKLRNPSDFDQNKLILIFAVVGGDGMGYFTPELGFDVNAAKKSAYLGLVGDGISYGIRSRDRTIEQVILRSNIWIHALGNDNLPARTVHTFTFDLAVGGGSPEALRRQMLGLTKATPGQELHGVVRYGGKPVPKARVHVLDEKGLYVSMARTDDAGAYRLALAAGKYQVRVSADGHEHTQPKTVEIKAADVELDLDAGPSGTVSFEVKDSNNVTLPAKLTFVRSGGATKLPRTLGERRYLGGAVLIRFHPGGQGSVSLPPGDYAVTASRGYEYEIERKTVTVSDGSSGQLDFSLRRSVDSTNYVCGDFHVHAMWSYDANDFYELKVRMMAAAGIELPVSTDHDYVGDFNPAIATLGLQKWINGVVGSEVTTGLFGHFNVFPITADPKLPNNGALAWFGKQPNTIFDNADKRWPGSIFQVNHPRSVVFGYFTYLGFDNRDASFSKAADWSTNFDAIEVFNDSGYAANADGTMRDWLSLIDRGVISTATGNSDSHNVATHEVGYPRTCVRLGTDEPANVSGQALVSALLAQRAVVSGGVFITLSVGQAQVGDIAKVSGSSVDVDVVVQAPTWVTVNKLDVISGTDAAGKPIVVKTITLDGSTADPTNPVVRFRGKVAVPLSGKDSWVVAAVQGSDLGVVTHAQRAFGVTNPLFLDVDGNGKFDAPRSIP